MEREPSIGPDVRCVIASEVYEYAMDATESFAGAVGRDLAYVLGAIVCNRFASFTPPFSQAIIDVLRGCVPATHPAWLFIEITEAMPPPVPPPPPESKLRTSVCAECGGALTWEPFLAAWLHDDDDGSVSHDGQPKGGAK